VLLLSSSLQSGPPLSGRVVDPAGQPIAEAVVISSGVGFQGWATSIPDGTFQLPATGAYVSVRHPKLKTRLIATRELGQPALVQLDPAAEADFLRVPQCSGGSDASRSWVGPGLRIRRPRRGVKGPVHGEHDEHWYIGFGRETLHLVNGAFWHAGLPSERTLLDSPSISVRSWRSGPLVGLDLSGSTADGKRWCWLGAQMGSAIEYSDASPEAAAYFDRLLKTVCY
jgi:hypothetical protein